MRLEDKAWQASQSVHEVRGLLGLIWNDFGAGELDARLHHCANRTGEGGLKAGIPERLFVNLDGPQRRFRSCHLKRIEGVLCSAGYWDFCADDINRRSAIPDSRFRYLSQSGGALSGYFIRQRRRLTGASHAGVEMQLGEAGPGVAFDHYFGSLHRLILGQMLPWVGTKMITSKDHSRGVKTDARREASALTH